MGMDRENHHGKITITTQKAHLCWMIMIMVFCCHWELIMPDSMQHPWLKLPMQADQHKITAGMLKGAAAMFCLPSLCLLGCP